MRRGNVQNYGILKTGLHFVENVIINFITELMLTVNKETYLRMPKEIQSLFTQLPNPAKEEVRAMFPQQTSGAMKKPYIYTNSGNSMGKPTGETRANHDSSSGSASRFFQACEFTEDDIPALVYCAKASRSERDEGLNDMQARKQDPSRKEGNPGGDNPRNHGVHERTNFHATVKPLTLMQYLIRLVTPPGGTVLDPFAGSGTTLVAAVKEGFNAIGIELEADHIPLIQGRVSYAESQVKPVEQKPEKKQLDLFT